MLALSIQKLHFLDEKPFGLPAITLLVKEDECYFTVVGLSSARPYADLIARTIIRQVGVPEERIKVFEVKTHMGYHGLAPSEVVVEEWMLDRSEPPKVEGTFRTNCPDFVRKAFGSLIGRPVED